MLASSPFGAIAPCSYDPCSDPSCPGYDANICIELDTSPTTNPATPLCSAAQVGQQCIPDDQAAGQAGTTPTSSLPSVCSTCNSSFQWCDGTKCINFTQAQQIAWAQQWALASASGTPPAMTVATSASPSGGFFSSPVVLGGLAILAGVAGWFAYKRMKPSAKS